MERKVKKRAGAGVITISIIQLLLSVISALIILVAIILRTDVVGRSTSELVISLIILLSIIAAIILILNKKTIGLYLYFSSVIINITYSIVVNGIKAQIIMSLILPILMGFFIYQNKETYGLKI